MYEIAIITDEEFNLGNFSLIIKDLAFGNNGDICFIGNFKEVLATIRPPRQVVIV